MTLPDRRRYILEPQHTEAADSPPDIFTDPAAVFNSPHRNDFSPQNALTPKSPILMGSTLTNHPLTSWPAIAS